MPSASRRSTVHPSSSDQDLRLKARTIGAFGSPCPKHLSLTRLLLGGQGDRPKATRRERKPCPTKDKRYPLDSGRPSHGRPLRSKPLAAGCMSSIKTGSRKKFCLDWRPRIFLSRDPAHCLCVRLSIRSRGFVLACLPFLWVSSSGGDHANRVLKPVKRTGI
jgi:hypothetical protein